MTLTLRIVNGVDLELGASPELVLNNRGANIGRALTCEWVLPDDGRVVSSRHCEVQFRENAYYLVDYGSTNGTFVGASNQPLTGAHRIAPSDRFRIGPYVIEARLAGAALQQHQNETAAATAAARNPGFGDWDDVPGGRPAPPPPPAPSEINFGDWELPKAAPDRASAWSEDVNRGTGAPSADDIFGSFTAKNEVDWNNATWSVDPGFDPFASLPDEEPGFAPMPGSTPPAPGGSGGFAPLASGSTPATGAGDGFAPMAAPPASTQSGSDPFAPLPGTTGPGGSFAPLTGHTPAPPPPSAPAPLASPPFTPTLPPTGGSFAPLDGAGQASPASPPSAPPFAPPAAPWSDQPTHEPTIGGWSPAGAPPANEPGPPLDPGPAAQPVPPAMRVRPSPVAHPPVAAAPEHAAPAPPPQPDAVFAALLGELGVPASQLKLSPEEIAAKTGRMLRHLIAGLMILIEARARAKEEMGAAGTALSFDGNNPLKFARNVDQALAMMLNPHLRGYMEAEGAIEEAYRDLQAHQIATLKAMQGALRETLDRFSPAAIKTRTKQQGLLAKVMPGQREAALWKAYEAQFSGVAEGSAEAFLEVFSREFRKAYEESSRRPGG